MYIVLGIITWLIILLFVWHDYENRKGIKDLLDVCMIGGILGGIGGIVWPAVWTVAIMILISKLIYKGWKAYQDHLDELPLDKS